MDVIASLVGGAIESSRESGMIGKKRRVDRRTAWIWGERAAREGVNPGRKAVPPDDWTMGEASGLRFHAEICRVQEGWSDGMFLFSWWASGACKLQTSSLSARNGWTEHQDTTGEDKENFRQRPPRRLSKPQRPMKPNFLGKWKRQSILHLRVCATVWHTTNALALPSQPYDIFTQRLLKPAR